MSTPIALLPAPRSVEPREGVFVPRDGHCIALVGRPADLRPAGLAVQRAARAEAGRAWQLAAGEGGPPEGIAVRITGDLADGRPQGYALEVRPDGVTIRGADPAGAFYGAQTLAQLLRLHPDGVPCLRIDDWPDFPARGILLDISRDKVPTMETLYRLVDEMSAQKLNQLQLYTEHTFAYRAHPQVWAEASPITGDEMLALDDYCRQRFVELVPNQNSFGHMERWLNLPRYRPMAEAPNGFEFPWGGRMEGPFSLCPSDPRAIELLASMYDELLPHFTSPLFNVGCDETFDLGQGRSKEECQERGTERVYLDFLLKVHKLVRQHGRTMQFWGDIIMHRPELVPELPENVIALEWGYEADHPFDRDGAVFAQAGVPFYVCPGTSSWNTIAGRTDNALGNLRNAADNGLRHGAIGYLNTDWGDGGHLQYLPASWLGYAAGAAYSWCIEANRALPIADALSTHVFRDRAGVMGTLAYDLGNVYQKVGKLAGNASVIYHLLMHEAVPDGVTLATLDATEAAIGGAIAPIGSARMERDDAALVTDEWRNAAAMLAWGCRRARLALGATGESADGLAAEMRRIRGEHRRLWLARNRPGGLTESLTRLAP